MANKQPESVKRYDSIKQQWVFVDVIECDFCGAFFTVNENNKNDELCEVCYEFNPGPNNNATASGKGVS